MSDTNDEAIDILTVQINRTKHLMKTNNIVRAALEREVCDAIFNEFSKSGYFSNEEYWVLHAEISNLWCS